MSVIRKIPEILRQDSFKITATLARSVHEDSKTRIINIQPGNATERNYAIAIDVGTTTIYGQVIDLISGKVLSQYGDFNGQISYGEDVISRIVFAEKPGGLKKLQEVVIRTINKVIEKIIKRAKIDPDEISTITLAGNTTMTQLMLRVNPRYIRRSPYVPASTLYPPLKAVDLGLALGDHVTALVYPAVSSYVGGDIVAGVMGSGIYRTEELTLFMDIGTNAEIVIGNKDWLACAAASAGPAFEGGGITFGMRATKGAIEDFSLDPLTLEPMNITIGNVRPKGICGSGLITTVAVLFEMGVIDNLGKFNRDLDTDRIREKDGVKLKFTMSTTAGAKAREQAEALIQANWKQIGVAMEIKNMPASVVWGEYTTKSQFDTLMVGWEPTVGMDPDYTARSHSKQIPVKYGTGSNYVQYENPDLDKLLEEGVLISDMKKRKAVYAQIQQILLEDVPFAPIFAYVFVYGKKSNLKGYEINPYVTDITWNVQEWRWE